MEQMRYFTVEEANGQLAWLSAQVQRIASLQTDMARLHQEVRAMSRRGRTNGHGGVEQEMAAKRREVDALADPLSRLMQEVHDQGIILRDPEQGLVDFPAFREGREIYLCWLLGEDQVRFWHEVDTGFASRQPL